MLSFNWPSQSLTTYVCYAFEFVEHRCTFPGCRLAIVIDGNQKIRRSICMAMEAGSIQYHSLPGSIKTGCTNSPKYKSRFCEQHLSRSLSANPQFLTEQDTESTNPINSQQLSSEINGQLVELLLEKKTTRSCTYYKVCKVLIMYVS